jgi:muramoyltetrapeptide carboxypeptidase
MVSVKPAALRPGDTIGIMASSSRIDDRRNIDAGVSVFESMGFRVRVHEQTFAVEGADAGTPEQKRDALHDLFRDKAVTAVFVADGGENAGRMLRLLDYGLIADNPKILLGYSDVTVLLNAIHEQTGLVTFHGPTTDDFGSGLLPEAQLRQCFNLLSGLPAPVPLHESRVITPGRATGEFLGGNFCVFDSIMGTRWQPDFHGKILFLEDLQTDITNLNRLLIKMINANVLDDIAGLVVGHYSKITDRGATPLCKTIQQLFAEAMAGQNKPCVLDAPFGHGDNLYTFAIGHAGTLVADENAAQSAISFDEPAVTLP